MAAAAEEAREEVKGVMGASATAALAALMLLKSFVAVLIVDLAGFRVREGVVGFGYLDEFLRGGFISTGDIYPKR